ncbi:peptidoglycan-binding protein [Tropicimonas isoalkanivorans]|uniref:Putative peptidoglycan binding domain-containing protein n=1 Tax=Tropicimonas isoalkanivorans TaxID=441112 RepID=A0A1I1E7P1_9RHOB|nr:peptidoglycan-binding protein [Tropicimonas isoalkanivorans]SFB83185.1 Putative peptidoglycan binding domain-containing protein [Tropicimonas isoalkanivorans]
MRRNERWVLQRSALILAILIGSGSGHWAQANAETAEDVFARARELSSTVSAPYDWREAQVLKEIQRLLDRIVYRYPKSDLASRILSRETIDGFDVAAVDHAIARLPYQSLSEQVGATAETKEPVGPEANRVSSEDALPEALPEAPVTDDMAPPQDAPSVDVDQVPIPDEPTDVTAPAAATPLDDGSDPAMAASAEEQAPEDLPAPVRVAADTPLTPRETLEAKRPDSVEPESSATSLRALDLENVPRVPPVEVSVRSAPSSSGLAEIPSVPAQSMGKAAAPAIVAAVVDGPERPTEGAAEDALEGAGTGKTAVTTQPMAREDLTDEPRANLVPPPPPDSAPPDEVIGPEVTSAPPRNPMAAASEPATGRERSRDRPLPRRVAKSAPLETATVPVDEGTEGPEPKPETAATPEADTAVKEAVPSEGSADVSETPTTSGLRQVGRCFVAEEEGAAGVEILIDVQIGPDGRITALPDLIAPSQPNADERTLYAKALSALDACAPYVTETAGVHRMAASPEGLRLVNDRPQPAVAESLPASETLNWLPASRETEDALLLSRTDVMDVQARLSALGFDPMGVDGSLGENSRAALAAWQSSAAIPATGFLNKPQLAALREQSASAFQAWMQNDANRALVEGTTQPEPAKRKASTRRRASLPPGYFWYKGRMCKKVLGNLIYSCK